jgi:uncharacterized protein
MNVKLNKDEVVRLIEYWTTSAREDYKTAQALFESNRAKKNIVNKVKAFAVKAKEEGINFESVILFGSHAKGRAKRYSDIDLAVFSYQFGKDTITEGANLQSLANKVDWRIEPHLLHPKDLKVRENPLVHEILTTGIKVI